MPLGSDADGLPGGVARVTWMGRVMALTGKNRCAKAQKAEQGTLYVNKITSTIPGVHRVTWYVKGRRVGSTVFSVKGTHLVSVSRDRSMKLTEVATERLEDNICSITPGALKGGLQAVDRHPIKDELFIGGADGTPKLYQMFRTKARVIGDDFNNIRNFAPLPGRIYAA